MQLFIEKYFEDKKLTKSQNNSLRSCFEMIKKFFYESFGANFPFSSVICTGKLHIQKKIYPQKSSIKFSVNNFKTTFENEYWETILKSPSSKTRKMGLTNKHRSSPLSCHSVIFSTLFSDGFQAVRALMWLLRICRAGSAVIRH